MTRTKSSSKSQTAAIFVEYLDAEGYSPQIDAGGDVVFRTGGHVYYLIIDEDDDIFFRLALPNFWPIESDAQRVRAMQACCAANAHTKVAKVFPANDNVWAVIEMFISPISEFKSVFPRCLSALRVISDRFGTEMRRAG